MLSTVPRLPFDLYLPVLGYVQNQSDLSSLSRVANDWHYEARPVLYRRIGTLSDHRKQQAFFHAVAQNESLALLVKELNLEFGQPLSSEESQVVRRGFNALKKLQKLSLHCATDDESIASLLEDYPFQLQRFSWTSVRDQDEELVLRFLSQQNQIRDLEIFLHGTSILSYNIPATTCPHLSILRGGRFSIDGFLPSRPITTLLWFPEFEESCDALFDLYGSLSRLRVLQLGGKWMRPRLTSMSGHLSALEVLELVHIWPEERDCLKTLAKLQCLVLSNWSSTTTPFPEIPTESRGPIVDGFFESNPSLKNVFIELPRQSGGQKLYQLWVRRGAECSIVSRTEILKWTPTELNGLWN